MDIENVTEQPITARNRHGEAIQFPRLTFRQLGAILAQLRVKRESALVDLLKRAEVPSKERVAAITEFDARPITLIDGMRWCQSVEGTMATLSASLRAANPDMTDEEIDRTLDDISASRLMETAAKLWGAVFNEGSETETDPLGETTAATLTGR